MSGGLAEASVRHAKAACGPTNGALRILASLLLTVVLSFHPWQTVGVTSYTPCSSGSITASGQHVRFGIVATRAAVPFGTRVQLSPPAYGRRYYTVEDRMAPGDAASIDVFTPDCAAAIRFGYRVERVRFG